MLNIENQKVMVKGLVVRGAQTGKTVRTQVRIKLAHEPDSASVLPELQSAVSAILREQNERGALAENDSKDVVQLSVKRDLGQWRYTLALMGESDEVVPDEVAFSDADAGGSIRSGSPLTSVTFFGEPVLTPKVSAVHGQLKVEWTVEATVEATDLVYLATMLGSEYVAATIAPAQTVIEFAAAQ